MKNIVLVTMLFVIMFVLPVSALDFQKLDMDTAAVGSFLQRIVNPRNRNNNPQGTAVYLEGYGIVVTFYTYFNSNNNYDAQFNQNNEELTRGLVLYLSSIRQLKENEKVVVAIKNSNQPYQAYTAQAQNNDLISFLEGTIKLEDLAGKIKISASAFVKQ